MKKIFDSDRLDRKEAATIMAAILASGKRVDIVLAPAGAGKSTLLASIDNDGFVASLNEVSDCDEFVMLSGSGRAKAMISAHLAKQIDAANATGGVVSFLHVPNMEIIRRRWKRVSEGSDDLRDTKALKRTFKAPLNQFDFIKAVKVASTRFAIL
jgi:ABC-type cobalamin transport system ATPase subunit